MYHALLLKSSESQQIESYQRFIYHVQARTHVQLALACQHSMIRVQHRLRFTMKHVYGHSGNWGNECADHAAALGTFGLISSHNVATRWIRHIFDASVCFDGCNNISDILERLQHIRTNATTSHQDRHLSSSASTVPSIDDHFGQNLWNPLLELLFVGQANGIFASYLVENDLAKIALSCHFALDLLCSKEEVLAFEL